MATVSTVTSVDAFATAVRDGIATPGLAVVVAKIDASGPASFAFDLGLKENRFAFARALRR